MTGYWLPVACGHCSSPLDHRNGTHCPSQAIAVAACTNCGREWIVTVTLRPSRGLAGERKAAYRAKQEASA